jgi:hypothetical protein
MSEKKEGLAPPNPSKKRKKVSVVAGVATVAASLAAFAVIKDESSASSHPVRPTPTSLEKPEPTTTTSTTIEKVKPDPAIESWSIVGSPAAQKDIRASLTRIKAIKDQRFWNMVNRYHPNFEADDEVFGIFPTAHTIKISDQERNYLPTNTGNPAEDKQNEENNGKWLDSSIVHESVQGLLYDSGKTWQGAEAENFALHIQAQVLEAEGADSSMINWVNNEIDPTDSPSSYWNRYKDGKIQP